MFFALFTALICSDSILNLLEKVTDGSFLFLSKTLVFLFLPFLNLSGQIRCPQYQYTNLTSALDLPLILYWFSALYSVKQDVIIGLFYQFSETKIYAHVHKTLKATVMIFVCVLKLFIVSSFSTFPYLTCMTFGPNK